MSFDFLNTTEKAKAKTIAYHVKRDIEGGVTVHLRDEPCLDRMAH